jgi:hypothetical protein
MRMNAASSYLHSAGRGGCLTWTSSDAFLCIVVRWAVLYLQRYNLLKTTGLLRAVCMDGLIAAELPGQTGISPIYFAFRAPPLVKDTYP